MRTVIRLPESAVLNRVDICYAIESYITYDILKLSDQWQVFTKIRGEGGRGAKFTEYFCSSLLFAEYTYFQ